MYKFTWDSYHIEKNEIIIQHSLLDYDFKLHRHDFTELVIILDGEGSHVIENKSYPLQKGDVYVITDDIFHGYEVTKHLELINILFQPKELVFEEIRKEMNGYRAMFEIEPLYRLENDFKAKLMLDIFQLSEITKITDEILSRSTEHSTENRILNKALVNLLVAKLSAMYDNKKEYKPRQLLQLSGLVDYIDNHLADELDAETLAKKASFSPRHFNRLFKSVFCMTPKEYIFEQRMLYACKLLCENNLAITEVAAMCGYPDSSYFSRLFFKKYQVTPREYRKQKNTDKYN